MAVSIMRRAPKSPQLNKAVVRSWGEQMLHYLALESSELSILLCDDSLIQKLNREHRGKDKPTDVLSFPQAEFDQPGKPVAGQSLALLGDVVISLDKAQRQAEGRKRPLAEEVRFLLAHGVLHLMGYDHVTVAGKQDMTRMTRCLVRACQNTETG
jgi:probable rRNA maturation factor